MHILTWNINGLRAKIANGDTPFMKFFKSQDKYVSPSHKYDVLCFQEQKCNIDTLLKKDTNSECSVLKELCNYKYIAHTKEKAKKGYAGAAIFSKIPFEHVQIGLGIEELDENGRVVTVKLTNENTIIVNVYVPNSGENLKNLDYRLDKWNVEFMKHIKKVEEQFSDCRIVLCGDFNAAVNTTDVYNHERLKNKLAGFHDEERKWISELIKSGFEDTFSKSIDTVQDNHYTFWSNLGGMRAKNKGWRIDYFFVKNGSWKTVKNLQHVMGSDHCPLSLEI